METNTLRVINFNETEKILKEYTEYLFTTLKGKIPSDYAIRNNISITVNTDNGQFNIIFRAPEYFKYIENGRRKGAKQPPIPAIKDFITKRRIIPKRYGNNKLPSINSLSFLIARSIKRRGIEPKFYLKKSIEETNNYFESLLSEALNIDISNNLNYILSPLVN